MHHHIWISNLGHSSFVAGMRVAPKQQELDAAAASEHFVSRLDLVSSLSEQPPHHQCLCDDRKVGRFRLARHDVCSRSKLVATSVSMGSLTVDIPTKKGVKLDAFSSEESNEGELTNKTERDNE